MKSFENNEVFLFWIFLVIGFCYFIAVIFMIFKSNKMKLITKEPRSDLSKQEKNELLKFAIPLSITSLSGSFFGYIDTIMLGRFVDSSFIAYYQNAFNLIASASVILTFMGVALLPIFARLNKENSLKLFRKSRLILVVISFLAIIFTLFVSKYLVLFAYGSEYLQSVLYLRVFSVLLFFSPIIELYINYYTAAKKTKIIAISLVISTIVNIILNYFLITIGLGYGMDKAVLGACIATIISRIVYLAILSFYRKFN